MMMLAFFPLWAELDFILNLWLVKVPEGALIFCQIILLMVFVAVSDGGLGNVVSSSGKISRFNMAFSLITISCIPIGFIVLEAGAPAFMMLLVFLIADIIWRVVQLCLLHYILHFPVRKFCLRTYLPVIMACLPVALCLFLTSHFYLDSPLWHIGHIIFIFLITALSAYYLGLRYNERERLVSQLSKLI